MAETLASTLNPSPFDPIGAVGGIMREPTVEGRGKKARELTPEIMRQESTAQENLMREEAGAKRRQIEEETKTEQGFARGVETAGRQLETAFGGMPERQITAFEPERGIELAGLTALMGAFAGAVSGRAGLAAMEGVSEGYRKGQEDLYKRQVDTYNAEVDKYKQKINEAKQIYDNAIKLETARRGAGMAELKKLEPLLQDSVITARARANDFKGVAASIQEATKLADQLEIKRTEAGLKPSPTVFPRAVDAQGAPVRSGIDPRTKVPFLVASPYEGLDAKSQQTMFQDERKNYNKIQQKQSEQVDKANKTLAAMDRAERALEKISTGGVYGVPVVGTPAQATMAAFNKDVSDFDAVSNEMQRQAYVPGEGQISNFERELFQRSNISLGRPKETNQMLINAYRAAAQNTKARAEFLDRFFRTNKTTTGAEELWNIYLTANPILVEDQNGNISLNAGRKTYQEFFSDPVVGARGSQYRLNFDTLLWEEENGR